MFFRIVVDSDSDNAGVEVIKTKYAQLALAYYTVAESKEIAVNIFADDNEISQNDLETYAQMETPHDVSDDLS